MNTFSENGNDFVGRLLHEGGVGRRTFFAFSQYQKCLYGNATKQLQDANKRKFKQRGRPSFKAQILAQFFTRREQQNPFIEAYIHL